MLTKEKCWHKMMMITFVVGDGASRYDIDRNNVAPTMISDGAIRSSRLWRCAKKKDVPRVQSIV